LIDPEMIFNRDLDRDEKFFEKSRPPYQPSGTLQTGRTRPSGNASARRVIFPFINFIRNNVEITLVSGNTVQ
jgi:hypothetical protein